MKKWHFIFTFAVHVSVLSASAFQRLPEPFQQSWFGKKVFELTDQINRAEITKDQAIKWLVQATGGVLATAAAAYFINKAIKSRANSEGEMPDREVQEVSKGIYAQIHLKPDDILSREFAKMFESNDTSRIEQMYNNFSSDARALWDIDENAFQIAAAFARFYNDEYAKIVADLLLRKRKDPLFVLPELPMRTSK